MNTLITETIKNKSVYSAFESMIINESNNSKVNVLIQSWENQYISDAKNAKIVKKELSAIKKLIHNSSDTIDVMDQISSAFLKVSAQYSKDHKAQEQLADILSKI